MSKRHIGLNKQEEDEQVAPYEQMRQEEDGQAEFETEPERAPVEQGQEACEWRVNQKGVNRRVRHTVCK